MTRTRFGIIFAIVTLPPSFAFFGIFFLLGLIGGDAGVWLPCIYFGIVPSCAAFLAGAGMGPVLFRPRLSQWAGIVRGAVVMTLAFILWVCIGFLLGPVQKAIEGPSDVPGAAKVLGFMFVLPVFVGVLGLGAWAGVWVQRRLE